MRDSSTTVLTGDLGPPPGVTVVIPAHNEQTHVLACLRAVLDTDYPALSVILVDDGSTDGTLSLARGLAKTDARVTVLELRARRGAAAARNLALAHCRDDYVFFTDADCMVSPDWIERGICELCRPGVVAIEGDIRCDTTSRSIRQRLPLNPVYNQARASLNQPGRDFPCGNFAARLSAVRRVGGFNANRYCLGREDTDLGTRLLALGEVRFVPGMCVQHPVETWTLRTLLHNAKRYQADVYFLNDHGHFHFAHSRILHPWLLLMLLFPPLIPLRLRLHSLADVAFLPKLYLYLLTLRLVIWHTALVERRLVI